MDLIEKLRECAIFMAEPVYDQAADEIERLRDERREMMAGLAQIMSDMDGLIESFGVYSDHPVRAQLRESRDKLLSSH